MHTTQALLAPQVSFRSLWRHWRTLAGKNKLGAGNGLTMKAAIMEALPSRGVAEPFHNRVVVQHLFKSCMPKEAAHDVKAVEINRATEFQLEWAGTCVYVVFFS